MRSTLECKEDSKFKTSWKKWSNQRSIKLCIDQTSLKITNNINAAKQHTNSIFIYLFTQSSIWIRNDMYEILAIACTILVSFYGIIAFNSTLFFDIADKLVIA